MSDLPIRPSQRRGAGRVTRQDKSSTRSVERKRKSVDDEIITASASPAPPSNPVLSASMSVTEPIAAGPVPYESSAAERAIATGEIDPRRRQYMIAEAAYYLATRRGFTPGFELEDWLQAERDVDALLARDSLRH